MKVYCVDAGVEASIRGGELCFTSVYMKECNDVPTELEVLTVESIGAYLMIEW